MPALRMGGIGEFPQSPFRQGCGFAFKEANEQSLDRVHAAVFALLQLLLISLLNFMSIVLCL